MAILVSVQDQIVFGGSLLPPDRGRRYPVYVLLMNGRLLGA